ncbi:hypothetical protein ACLESD_44650, partial [Pyxidicoccus sp. 3LFB2]
CAPWPLWGAVVCRYCRNTQAQGMLCDHCGMRLPRARPAANATAGAKRPGGDEDAWLPCPTCHTPTRPGKTCAECGTRARVDA